MFPFSLREIKTTFYYVNILSTSAFVDALNFSTFSFVDIFPCRHYLLSTFSVFDLLFCRHSNISFIRICLSKYLSNFSFVYNFISWSEFFFCRPFRLLCICLICRPFHLPTILLMEVSFVDHFACLPLICQPLVILSTILEDVFKFFNLLGYVCLPSISFNMFFI